MFCGLCVFQAKDTPEPDFDLSDCNLKDIPSGVFVLCRVLLKQHLYLQNNQLQSLNGGGTLKDLSNLTVINLSFNRFTRVPDEFCNTLKNLRVKPTRHIRPAVELLFRNNHFGFFVCLFQELFLSHNAIDILPASINKLTNLQLLDVSHNHLTRIDQIGFMPTLRILNITGNINLKNLPAQLSTCDSLNDIALDADYIVYPPPSIIERGTVEILKFLLEQNDGPIEEHTVIMNVAPDPLQCVKQTTVNMLNIERGCDVVREMNTTNDKYSREKVCIHGMLSSFKHVYDCSLYFSLKKK